MPSELVVVIVITVLPGDIVVIYVVSSPSLAVLIIVVVMKLSVIADELDSEVEDFIIISELEKGVIEVKSVLAEDLLVETVVDNTEVELDEVFIVLNELMVVAVLIVVLVIVLVDMLVIVVDGIGIIVLEDVNSIEVDVGITELDKVGVDEGNKEPQVRVNV